MSRMKVGLHSFRIADGVLNWINLKELEQLLIKKLSIKGKKVNFMKIKRK